MCMNCGCGEVTESHGDPRNITKQDVQAATDAGNASFDQVLKNMQDSLAKIREGSE